MRTTQLVVLTIISFFIASSGFISFSIDQVQADDAPTFEPQSSDWWNTNWSYSKKITINHSQVAGNLANFPICINITDSDLANKAQSDGDDIVFTFVATVD